MPPVRRLPLCLGALAVLCALAAAPAQAARTFGSDLSLPVGANAAGCGSSGAGCTWTPSYYRDGNAHPDGAPIDGVVVRFRIKGSAQDVVTFRLSVIPRGQIGAATVGTGPTITLTGGGATDTVPARLPARAGAHVGLDTAPLASVFSDAVAPSGSFGWTPKLVDREAARGGAGDRPSQSSLELLVNADIEPDLDLDGYGDETQDPNESDPRVPDPAATPPPCGDVDLVGDNGRDTIVGGRLQDNIRSLGGVDDVAGGDERDCIDGGASGDRLNGNGNADRVAGGSGNDRIWGGDLYRRNLDPAVAEQDGGDFLLGGSGADQIIGGGGHDLIRGGSGDDDLYADYTAKGPAPASKDLIFGEFGADNLTGSRGGEVLDGGAGDDDLNGNRGIDRYSGGPGNDMIVSLDGRRERVACGSGRDEVIADRNDKVAKDCEQVARR